MGKKRKIMLERFEQSLFEIVKNYLSSNQIEEITGIIRNELIKYPLLGSSLTNLHRLLDSLFNKYSFFTQAIKFNHHLEIVCAIACNSNYLTDIVVRNPEFLHQLFDQDYLQKKLLPEILSEEINYSLKNYKTFKAKVNFLRYLKRRYTLKIGVFDILGFGTLEEVTEQVSLIAQLISSNLFDSCYRELLREYGIEKYPNRYTIVSLGKLGGNELNYSSDIDLMFFYDKNSKIKGNKRVDYSEVLEKAVQLFVSTSNELSPEGFIYRIDLRLRPDGSNSPLAKTLNDTIFYYETRGEAWERQMLIKASYAGGNKSLYDDFIKRVTPFIYPKSFMESPVAQITKMRNNVEISAAGETDIKKSRGGIRDIEFLVQMLQLLNGGKFQNLRSGNTLEALSLLFENKFISKKEYNNLTDSYIFYRKLEHYLQLMNNLQTHEVPSEPELKTKLSFFLSQKNSDSLDDEIRQHKVRTRKVFNKYFEIKNDLTSRPQTLELIEYRDDPRAKRNIRYLRSGAGLLGTKEFSSRSIELFKTIEPGLVEYLKNSLSPDHVLDNFSSIIRASKMPSVWYNELQNSQILTDLLNLCEYSRKFTDDICSNPSMSDHFFSGSIYLKDIEPVFHEITTKHLLLILTTQLTLGLIDHKKFSLLLSSYLADKVANAGEKFFKKYRYFIAGLGSFGIKEMVYSSDIDLVIVVEGLKNSGDIEEDCQAFIKEVNNILNPFSIDFKLRPEGKNSPIVWDLKQYEQYLLKRAELWEFQSLLKIYFVGGSEKIFKKFTASITSAYSKFKVDDIYTTVFNMHQKIINEKSTSLSKSIDLKFKYGALVSMEYLIDYFIMDDKDLYSELLGADYSRKIKKITGSKLSTKDAGVINKNLNDLKMIELIFQSYANSNKSKLMIEQNRLDHLRNYFAKRFNITLTETINRILSDTSKIIQKLR